MSLCCSRRCLHHATQVFLLHLDISTFQGLELHLDMSTLHSTVLHLDGSGQEEPELPLDLSTIQRPVLQLDLCFSCPSFPICSFWALDEGGLPLLVQRADERMMLVTHMPGHFFLLCKPTSTYILLKFMFFSFTVVETVKFFHISTVYSAILPIL
jgi:hypothetical protein